MTRARPLVRHDVMPDFIEPCLAKLASAPPEGANWVREIKFDGYRLQARIENGAVRLLTRNGHDWTGKFSALAKALRTLNVKSALIDGEAVVENDKGITDFALLVSDLKAARSDRILFFAFDLLFLNGMSTLALPLTERKTLLRTILKSAAKTSRVRFSEHITGSGATMLAHCCKLGLEGIVSKQRDKPYRSGRHGDWVKSKCVLTDEFVIAGYLESTAIKTAIGALVLGFYEQGALIYAGRAGTGFDRETARELWRMFQSLCVAAPPFAARLSATQRRGVIWVQPKLVAEIEYRAWTSDGLLRHAAFKALREDKPVRDVQRPV